MTLKYAFVEKVSDEGSVHGIKLKEGDYSGLVWSFGRVRFEPTEGDQMGLNFEYTIHYCPPNITGIDTESLETIMGDILTEILEESIKKNELIDFIKECESNESRDSNSEQSGSQ